jgi:hypothetical protein
MAKQRELLPEQPVQEPTEAATDSAVVGLNNRAKKAMCPVNPDHPGARTYKTAGRVRYCVCDTCGQTWKQTGPKYSRSQEWAYKVAERLRQAARNPSTIGNRQVVIMDVPSVDKLADQIEDLASESESDDVDSKLPA